MMLRDWLCNFLQIWVEPESNVINYSLQPKATLKWIGLRTRLGVMIVCSPFTCPRAPALSPHVYTLPGHQNTEWKRLAEIPLIMTTPLLLSSKRVRTLGANNWFGGGLWPSWNCHKKEWVYNIILTFYLKFLKLTWWYILVPKDKTYCRDLKDFLTNQECCQLPWIKMY